MIKLILTCEHGGNQIPEKYQHLFHEHQQLLQSHEGYDKGALELFHHLSDLADISFFSETSRLLVEVNRSAKHQKLFSPVTKPLSEKERKEILQEHYFKYRDKVETLVQDFISGGRKVVHVAVHSFTPVLNGEERQTDIGLLYDPKRKEEQSLCYSWKQALSRKDASVMVRYNYPYLGISDGFPTYLRKKLKPTDYVGVELEVNQKFVESDTNRWQSLKEIIRQSLEEALREFRALHEEKEE